MLGNMPAEAWALVGIVVTAMAAFIRERTNAKASPYETMAKRLERVEARAELMPRLAAQMSLLEDWAEESALWMSEVEAAYKEDTGKTYFPPPPLPPPHFERRVTDMGFSADGTNRRHL